MDLGQRHRDVVMAVQPMETQLVIDRGEGSYLVANDGTRYLDLASGIAVNAVGYTHPQVVAAIEGQLKRHLHLYSGTGYQNSLVTYAEALIGEIEQGYKVFFGNSGTEAVEAAIKLARFATGRPAIIAFRGAFHGRTLGALSLTDSAARYRSPYEPLLPSVYHVPSPAFHTATVMAGAYGIGAHRADESIDAEYAFGELPLLIIALVRRLWQDPP